MSRCLRLLLVVAIPVALALTGLGVAARPERAAAEETPSAEPTVVRELVEKRTADSSTYLLSSGAYRCRLYSADRYYMDAAGAWVTIDPTLVPSTGDAGVTTAAAPVNVTVTDEAPGAPPVTVSSGKWTVSMDLLDCAEEGMEVKGPAATFPAVAKDVRLTYTATGTGVKEVISLASAAAPDSYVCRLTHPGLELRQDEAAQWGLYEPGAKEALFRVGPMNACDSSRDAAGEPAWCDAARLSVKPGKGASTLTFTLPRAWLEDPARVYPVLIDPQVDLNGSDTRDTYLSEGYPSTAYGSSDQLACGNLSSGAGRCWTLVRFPQLADVIPAGSHISDADFLLRQFWQPDNPEDGVRIAKLGHSAILWGEASTWNNAAADILLESTYTPQQVAGDAWLQLNCGGAVQDWLDHGNNKGWLLYESEGSSAAYSRKFRSNEYAGSAQRPFLEVDYEAPGVTIGGLSSTYHVGDTVTVTAQATNVAYVGQIRNLRIGVNRSEGVSANYHGVMAWFKEPPTGNASWVYQSCPGGGYVAYYNNTAYNVGHAELLPSSCSWNAATKTATFAFRATGEWTPLASGNDVDSIIEMRTGGDGWSGGWTDEANSFAMTAAVSAPEPLTSLSSTTTATSAWFGPTGMNDANTSGRGTVTLSWPQVPAATGYQIHLWDGVKYDQVGTIASGATTTWTSAATLYPTDSAIAAIPAGFTGNPFATYGSKDLRDNPNALYKKMAGSAAAGTDYRFKVVPVNGSAVAAINACAELRVTLDNRSLTSSEDPQHVTYDFGEWDGHSLAAELDRGVLTAATTDLAIASWGPPAELSRTYRSDQPAAGKFAPGWFFGFEQKLAITPTQIVYTDAERLPHTFNGSGSVWTAPNGFLAGLAPSGSNWRLTFFDQSYLTFDSAGKLISETDDHGNATVYTWSGSDMTRITAASAQQINLTYASGKLSSASYATAAGTRTVSYATASPWSATLYQGVTGLQRKLTYGYDATPRLTTLTQADWPAAGQSAVETVVYTSGKVTELRYADYNATSKPDARASVAYDSATQATCKRYGKVGASTNQVMNQEVYVWSAASAGVPNQLASRTSGTGGLANTETYNYAFDRQLAVTTASDGGQTSDTFDLSHDLTSSTTTTGTLEADNETTAYAYDGLHRTTSETSYQSPTVYSLTTSTYTGADLTAAQTTNQAGALLSASSFTRDAQGRTTQEKHLVSGTVSSGTWTQTDYSNFAASGEPQTTIARAVKLSPTASPQDLTQTASYDAFGNQLTQSDWGGRTTATSTYDIAGNLLTSTDSAGVVSRTSYDCMGNAKESWRTASGTNMKADWSTTSYDAIGRALTVTTKRSDASGNPTTQSVATTAYDGAGNELSADDTSLGGQAANTTYDASANATQSWSEGVLNTTEASRSTRSVYDAEGNVTYESLPGNAATPGPSATCAATTYDDAGNVLSEKQPDGAKTLRAYDGQANELVSAGDRTVTSADYQPWDAGSAYDAAGQATSETDAQQSHEGLTTTTTLDKLGRSTSEKAERDNAPSEPETTTTYNNLGWVLQSVDASGVTTQATYDAHGAVTSQTIGSRATTSAYHAVNGRLLSVTDADGTVLTYTYDAFGHVTRELHTSGAVTLKDVGGAGGRTIDSLGRITAETEAVSGVARTWTFPVNAATGSQETLAYGGSPATSLAVTRNGREMETARTATASGVTVTLATSDTTTGRDTADRWTQRTITQSGRAARTQNRAFDAAGRHASQSGLGFSSAGSYSYDANSGRKSAESLPLALGGTISGSFGYYAGGRLATATTNGAPESFSFDEAGNLVLDAITDVGETQLFYDAANRLTSSAYTPALDGAEATTTYYGWDAANAWRTCQGPDASATQANEPIDFSYNAQGRMSTYANSATSASASYTYDASGQRTKSVVAVGATSTTTSFAYDGLTLLKLAATQGSTTWRIDYLTDEEGTPYGGVYRSPSSSTTPTYFTLVTTDRGDIVELCDADGVAFAAYRYDAWGSPQGEGSSATGVWTQGTSLINATLAGQIAGRQILRYAGYAYDAESGLYYCSARYYDPATRQWTTGDPAKADGEESAYQYCGGEPVGGVDPSGRMTVLARDKATRLKSKIRSAAIKYVKKVVPYVNAGHSVSTGLDCAAFVGLVLWEARVPHIPSFYGPDAVWVGDRFIDHYGKDYGRTGIPSVNYFHRNRKTKYQTGDVIVHTNVHTALIVMEGSTPWVYECSPWAHRSDGVVHGRWDGTQRCRLSKRFNVGGFKPDRSARYFMQSPRR